MALFEMPLPKLRQYTGISGKPADFDEYWDRALREVGACSLDYELEPADISSGYAECFYMYFTGVGGARICAKLVRPKAQNEPGPGLAVFHGYSGSSGGFFPLLPYAAQGITAAALDCRGQAGRSEDVTRTSGNTYRGLILRGLLDEDPDGLYFRQVYLDTVQLVRILMSMETVDASRVGATGGSQGGALTLACAALEPRVKLAAAYYPFLCDFRRVYEMDLFTVNAYEEFKGYFRLTDPLHETEELLFHRLGYIDNINLAPRIKAGMMLVTGMMDQVCPPSTQFAAYNRMTCEKSMLLLPEYAHEAPWQTTDRVFSFLLGL